MEYAAKKEERIIPSFNDNEQSQGIQKPRIHEATERPQMGRNWTFLPLSEPNGHYAPRLGTKVFQQSLNIIAENRLFSCL